MFCHDNTGTSPDPWTTVCICTKQPLYSIYVDLYLVCVISEVLTGCFSLHATSIQHRLDLSGPVSMLCPVQFYSCNERHLSVFETFILSFLWTLSHFWNFVAFWIKTSAVKSWFLFVFLFSDIFFLFVFKWYECNVNSKFTEYFLDRCF